MTEAIGANTLWAMEASALADLTERAAISAVLPVGLAKAAGMMGISAANAGERVRYGAALVLRLAGPLSPKGSYGGTSTERFADQILAAAADPTVASIVIPIMSMGGMVFGTAEAADAVYLARQAKPVIAVASPVSFSAAHWIGCQASAYYASTSAQVGCAGVRAAHVDVSRFEDKIGMKTTLIASSRDKIAAHPHAPLSDVDRALIEAVIATTNVTFRRAIAKGRGIALGSVADVHGAGKRYSAPRAAERGMIDGVKTLRQVIALAFAGGAELDLIRRRAAIRQAASDI